MAAPQLYPAFARYNSWMNEKLYALCAGLPDEERKRNRKAFFASLHGTLNHILLADRVWMLRFTGDRERFASRDRDGKPIHPRGLDHVLYDDFDLLRSERVRTDTQILEWVRGLDQGQLDAPLAYHTIVTDEDWEVPLWWGLSHFFNHQTHHRGQVTTLLSQLGIDPGLTDLVVFLHDEEEGKR